MGIREEYEAIEQALVGEMRPELKTLRDASNVDLMAQTRALGPLQRGELAPPFALNGTDGRMYGLHQILARSPVFVHFYRGHWCPFCQHELKAFSSARHRFDELGVQLVFLSPDSVEDSRQIKERFELNLLLLADEGARVARAFGVEVLLNDDGKAFLTAVGHVLPTCDAQPCWSLPTPSSFLIARDTTILYSHRELDFRSRLDPVDMIIEIKRELNLD